MTYSEKLKSPLWQRKRLEILNAAEFTCVECESKTETLAVHHCYYERGKMPWEYPDWSLKCLCEICHEERRVIEDSIKKILSTFSFDDLTILHGDILYAVAMHGINEVAKKCRSLGA